MSVDDLLFFIPEISCGDNFQIIQHFLEEEIGEPVEKRICATYGD